MSQSRLVAAGALCVLVIVAIWLATRSDGGETARQPSTGQLPYAGSDPVPIADAPAAPRKTGVRRLASPAERTSLLEAIRHQRERRAPAGVPTAGGPGTATAPPALPSPTVVDKQYIRAAVRDLIPLLSECYEEGLERDPKLAGNVVVEFTIEGEREVGGVIAASTIDDKRSDLRDPAVRECIQETMYALAIDPPPDGGVVNVTYPFAFAPSAP